MSSIQPRQFARIMTLPQDERSDLLEFLGATPVPARQIDALIGQVSQMTKRALVQGGGPGSDAPPAAE